MILQVVSNFLVTQIFCSIYIQENFFKKLRKKNERLEDPLGQILGFQKIF